MKVLPISGLQSSCLAGGDTPARTRLGGMAHYPCIQSHFAHLCAIYTLAQDSSSLLLLLPILSTINPESMQLTGEHQKPFFIQELPPPTSIGSKFLGGDVAWLTHLAKQYPSTIVATPTLPVLALRNVDQQMYCSPSIESICWKFCFHLSRYLSCTASNWRLAETTFFEKLFKY